MNLSDIALKPKLDLSNFPYLIEEPDEIYHSKRGEYLSSHLLGDYRKCPYLFQKKRIGLVKDKDSTAYAIGRATHKLILEGRNAYNDSYAIGGPINLKTGKFYEATTKAYEKWSLEQDKDCLTETQANLVEDAYQGFEMNSIANNLVSIGFPEKVIRTEYTGTKCQIRMDWFNPEQGLVDLKTCEDLNWFEADARRYGYIHQMAFYRAILQITSGKKYPVHIIAVEKREPNRCGVWRIGEDVLAIAQKENEAAIKRLLMSQKKDFWPTGYEDVRDLNYL